MVVVGVADSFSFAVGPYRNNTLRLQSCPPSPLRVRNYGLEELAQDLRAIEALASR